MAINYDLQPRPGDVIPSPDPLDAFPDGAEQEHAKDCDINVMIKRVMNGQMVNGQNNSLYGYDDTTMTGLAHRIQKAQTEAAIQESIKELENTEISQEEADELQKYEQFKNVKVKVRKKEAKTNDDQTTNANAPTNEQNPTPPPTPNPGEKTP